VVETQGWAIVMTGQKGDRIGERSACMEKGDRRKLRGDRSGGNARMGDHILGKKPVWERAIAVRRGAIAVGLRDVGDREMFRQPHKSY
jgi:hypothetical protein